MGKQEPALSHLDIRSPKKNVSYSVDKRLLYNTLAPTSAFTVFIGSCNIIGV